MHMMAVRGVCLAVLCAAFAAGACSSGSGDDSGGKPGKYAAKRSATCLAWQDASCDFIADKCSSVTRAECDELYLSLFCESDQSAQACMDALPGATCPTLPDACVKINDPSPVIEFCGEFIEEACKAVVRCEGGTMEDCRLQAQQSLVSTCSYGVGLDPSADQCLAELPTASCEALPESCKGVIKTSQQSTATVAPAIGSGTARWLDVAKALRSAAPLAAY